MTETPKLLTHTGVFSNPEGSDIISQPKDGGVSSDRLATKKEMETMVADSSTVYSGSSMVESEAIGTYSPL